MTEILGWSSLIRGSLERKTLMAIYLSKTLRSAIFAVPLPHCSALAPFFPRELTLIVYPVCPPRKEEHPSRVFYKQTPPKVPKAPKDAWQRNAKGDLFSVST